MQRGRGIDGGVEARGGGEGGDPPPVRDSLMAASSADSLSFEEGPLSECDQNFQASPKTHASFSAARRHSLRAASAEHCRRSPTWANVIPPCVCS